MKIYTRTGDGGETSLLTGARVLKNDPRIEAYGTLDELNACIGIARASWPESPIDNQLSAIQADLFELGAHLAADGDPRFPPVPVERVTSLEASIDEMETGLPPLRNFILPGGSLPSAHLQLARTVCRRAERLVISGSSTPHQARAVAYLNRLSDYLFVAARYANHRTGVADVEWKRP
ncbi:MAG: cob(I)yrinic acid a,c-diamide adenosyltransferase [Thermoanaerobaculia bacterium]